MLRPPWHKYKGKASDPSAASLLRTSQIENTFSDRLIRRCKSRECSTQNIAQQYAVFLGGVRIILEKAGRRYVKEPEWGFTEALRFFFELPDDASFTPLDLGFPGLFEATGCISNATNSHDRREIMVFINTRLVQGAGIKEGVRRALRQQNQRESRIILLNITVDSSRVDVNYKADKSDVRLLDQDLIVPALSYGLTYAVTRSRPTPSALQFGNDQEFEVNLNHSTSSGLDDLVRSELEEAARDVDIELMRILKSRPHAIIVSQASSIAIVHPDSHPYLFNYKLLIQEALVQVGLQEWAQLKHRRISFDPPINVVAMLNLVALSERRTIGDLASTCSQLDGCLKISNDGKLLYLPYLVRGLPLNVTRLPEFLSSIILRRRPICKLAFLRALGELFNPGFTSPASRTREELTRLEEGTESFLNYILGLFGAGFLIASKNIKYAVVHPSSGTIRYS